MAHADRWYRARRRGVAFEQWLPNCPPRCTPQPCLVPGCRFGRHRSRLCHNHHAAWTTTTHAGSAQAWAATVPTEGGDRPGCRVPSCELWASFSDGFCVSHQGRFNAYRRRTGVDDREAFLAAVALAGVPRIDLTGLGPQLKLEVQYIVQCFLDHGPRRVNLSRWNAVIRALHARGATSLLDRTAPEWIAALRLGRGNPDGALFINWGRDQVDRLVHGSGWDREFPLDTWTLGRVGHAATGVARITFSAIVQPWLRDLAEQWARHRLSIGIGPAGVCNGVGVLGRFSTYLDTIARPPRSGAELTRVMVQDWCHDLARDHPEPRSRVRLVTALSTFLRDVHRYGWAPEMPSTTVVFSEDFPRTHGTGPARALTEYVIAQIESDEALARLTHPDHQLMTRIMIRCGLRAGDCRQLTFDCLVHDGDGHSYLQYLNHKMKRTAFVPVDDDLAARIRKTLPNGYCGMPLNSPCEHANPCLTCPMFITNADFLPQHEVQLKHTSSSSTSPARKDTCAWWRRTRRSSPTCNTSSPPAKPAPPRPSRRPPMLADNSHHLLAGGARVE